MQVFNLKNQLIAQSNIPIKGYIPLRDFYLWPETTIDTDLIFVKCKELDKSTVFENGFNSNLIAKIPIDTSSSMIRFTDARPLFYPLACYYKTLFNLHITITDSNGNKIPFKQCAITLLNK